MYLRFAWRYFKAKKSANAINIIAWVTAGVIAFATMCQVLVLSVFNGFEGLVKSLYASFYTDLRIIPAKGKTFILTEEKISRLKMHPSIGACSMIAEEKALLRNDSLQTIIYLKGVDENYPAVSGVASKVFRGKFSTGTTDEPEMIVGSGIQNAASISIDGPFSHPDPTIILPRKATINPSDMMEALSEGNVHPAGVFAIQQEFDSRYAITNIGFVKQQMGFAENEYSAAECKLKPGTSIDKARKEVADLLGPSFIVQTKYQQNTSLYNTMKMEKWVIYAVLTLILLIAAFNMVSALTMLVLEKQKDISILQSLGATRSMILKIFLSEGLLLGSIGAATGIGLAYIICLLQLKYKLVKLEGDTFLIDYFPVQLQLTDFLLVSVTVTLIAFMAAWFPSFKASRQAIELR